MRSVAELINKLMAHKQKQATQVETVRKLKEGKLYDVRVIETYPMYEKLVGKDGYERIIRYLDEYGTMTQEEIITAVCNLKRTTPGGSPITVLKVIGVSPISLSDKEIRRYID